jgi:putative transposase
MDYHAPLLPGKMYHVFNHAVGFENLFRNAENYPYFLNLVSRHILPVCEVYAYCLLPNHFHMMVMVRNEAVLTDAYRIKKEVDPPDDIDWPKYVIQQFSNCFNAYAKAYNKWCQRRGSLFIDYMRRKEISSILYFRNCIHYIHFNPVSHSLCDNINDWHWTSYHACLTVEKTQLNREVVLTNFEGKEQFIQFHNTIPEIGNEEMEFGFF